MGFIDSIRTALGLDGGIDDDYDEPSIGDMPVSNTSSGSPRPQPLNDQNRLNINVTAQLQVILVKPEKFADTKGIADHLNNKKTVVLNLESTTPDVTRRIIDFLGGVAYANGGTIKPVANNTFIITPYNVGFQGDELSAELESNGVLL